MDKIAFMFKHEFYNVIYRATLDYADDKVIERCAKWGLDTFELLKQHKLIITASDNERGTDFMYAVTTAMIVGEFGNFCFDDNCSDESEIDLGDVELELDDVKEYLNEDTDDERREELRRMNYVNIQDIWMAIQKRKREIHKSLVKIYTEKKEEDPDYAIFTSLVEIFEEKGEEVDEIIAPYSNSGQEMDAYEYIRAGFQY